MRCASTILSNRRSYESTRKHRSSGLVAAVLLLIAPLESLEGGTFDGNTPASESACDGLKGQRGYGLCVAYCEAQDCDVNSQPSCAPLREDFQALTGRSSLPCDLVLVSCEACSPANPDACASCETGSLPRCSAEDAGCTCGFTTEGQGVCMRHALPFCFNCCDSSSDCPPGHVCVVGGDCPIQSVCVPLCS
jgi:hypothetical protein